MYNNDNIFKKAMIPNKVPFNTIFLLFFSFLISFLAYKNPMLYEIFYEKINPQLNWSWFTGIFLHGTGNFYSMIKHLTSNLIIATLIFGYMIENILGTGKAFFYTIFSIIFTLLYSYISGHYGHGASSITYAFIAFGIFICLEFIKRFRWKSFAKPFFLFSLVFIGYSIYANVNLYLNNSNIGGRNAHTISFIVGIILSLLWQSDISGYFKSHIKTKFRYTSYELLSILLIFLMSGFLIFSIFSAYQELDDRKMLKEAVQDIGIPQTKKELNNNSGQIVVRFEDEMLPIIHSYYKNISIDGMYTPAFKWKWLDTKTLYMKVYSPLGNDVNKFEVVFDNLQTLNFEPLERKMKLSYGE